MPLYEMRRAAVRSTLRNMDMAPWHRCFGVMAWRNGLHEWKFAVGRQIVGSAVGIEAATDFVMTNGYEGTPSGWTGRA